MLADRKLQSFKDTEDLAEELEQHIRSAIPSKGIDIGLSGGLGAGKTTLVSILAKRLGFQEASSPTYVLQNHYGTVNGITLEHWDLYRVKGAPEELMSRPSPATVRIIEWCDRDEDLMAKLEFCFRLSR